MYDLSRELTAILINICWLQNLRERLEVIKQEAHEFEVKGFNLRKLSELEFRKLSD
jgi:hypothetical protein